MWKASVLASLAALLGGCGASSPAVSPVRTTAPATAAPSLDAKDLVFTEKDLEEIRGVAIRYYEEKKPEHWEAFVEELKTGGIFLKDEFPGAGPGIGRWKCEAQEDDGGFDLMRDPGLTPTGRPMAIYFYVHLVKKNGRWTGVYHSYREVRWQMGPSEEPPPGNG